MPVAVPTSSGTVAVLPDPLAEIALEGICYVEVWVRDLGDPGVGITGGQIDLGYSADGVRASASRTTRDRSTCSAPAMPTALRA